MATFLQTLFGVRFDRGIGENNEDHPKMKMKKSLSGRGLADQRPFVLSLL